MTTRILGSLVMVMGCAAHAVHAADAPRCELRLLSQVEAQVRDDGRVLVAGTVNGHDVWFEMRTIDGIPLFREAAISELGLKTTDIRSTQVGGTRIATKEIEAKSQGKVVDRYVKLIGLQLGRLKIPNWEALIVSDSLPGVLPTYRDRPIVGSISAALFTITDAEIDLADNRINIFEQSDCKGDPPYWSGEFTTVNLYFDSWGTMVFPMELDGQLVSASLIGGMRESRLDENVARKYFGFDSGSPGIEKHSSGFGGEVASFKAMSLTAEGLNIRNTQIRLLGGYKCTLTSKSGAARAIGYSDCENIVPMSLGTDVLKQLRIYIASKKGKIYFSKVAAAVPKP